MQGGGAVTSTYTGPVTIDPSAGAAVITVDGGATLALMNATAALTSSAGPLLKVTGTGTLGFGGNVNLGSGGEIFAATTIGFLPAASTTITMNTQITDGATAGSVNQNGAGTTVLAVDNSYSGATTVTNGVLEPQSLNAIPTSSAITAVGNASTGYLGLTGVGETTIQNTITLDGRPAATADIDNISGSNTITGNMTGVTGGNNYTLQSDAGLLTVSGNFACGGATTGARIFNLQGAGTGNYTGQISDGTSSTTPVPFVTLDVNGPGTWTLSRASGNTYSGGTVLNGGTLVLASTGGSATGTGSVTLNGGILASTPGTTITITGALVAGTAAHEIAPGGVGAIGTLAFGGVTSSNLTTFNFDLGSPVSGGSYTGDLVDLTAAPTFALGTNISFGTNPTALGDYRLFEGVFGSPTLSNFVLPTPPGGDSYALSTSVDSGYIDLVVAAAGPPTLTWNNTGAGAPTDGVTWDTTNNNWNNGSAATTYSTGALVTFNDTNNSHYAVTLTSTVTPGSVTVNNSLGNYTISGAGGKIVDAGAFTKSGSGTMTIGTALSVAGTTSISAGTLKLATGVSGGSGPAITSPIDLTSLSITGTGVLDVNNDHVIITYGASDPFSTIAGYIKSGYNSGGWNGPGIISSAAQIKTNGLSYGLGYADGKDGKVSGLVSGQIEVAYTLLGDANLDGLVNAADFTILAANFNQPVTGWDQGDFNYDGLVNAADFTDLAANFNQSVSGAATAGDVAALDAFAAANGLLADVPEPTSMGLLTLGAVGVLARRRRQNR
jgi:autotransporter-associated beta strand protein